MNDPWREGREAERIESDAPFELAEDAAAAPDASARALAEHQMEAMEELREETPFEIEERLPELAEGAAEEEAEAGESGADAPLVMDLDEAKKAIESILFLASEPLRPRDISAIFRGVSNVNAKVVRKLLGELAEEYRERTLQIVEVAGGFRLCTRAEFSPWVKRFLKTEKKARLSQAALEALAILAYKQPITKAEVEEIRRVDCGGVLNTLLERGLIRILGRRDVVGRPIVYGTTPLFLEHFGFKSLSDMPNPEEFEATEELGRGPLEAEGAILALEEGQAPPPESRTDEPAEAGDIPAEAAAASGDGGKPAEIAP